MYHGVPRRVKPLRGRMITVTIINLRRTARQSITLSYAASTCNQAPGLSPPQNGNAGKSVEQSTYTLTSFQAAWLYRAARRDRERERELSCRGVVCPCAAALSTYRCRLPLRHVPSVPSIYEFTYSQFLHRCMYVCVRVSET